jgi:hypothetical protein
MTDQLRVRKVAQRILAKALPAFETGALSHCPDVDVWDIVWHLDAAEQRAICDAALAKR